MRTVPFFMPEIGEAESQEILSALSGKECKVALLEERFKQYVGAKHAISTADGTSAMHLCLCAIDLKRGDKVICSVNCHPFVPEVIRHFDAEPIFVDVSESDFNLLPEKCEEILEKNDSKKLRGIIVSHVGGRLADVESFYKLGKKYGIKIIEDATHAMGLEHGGKKVGALGADATIFSFMPDRFQCVANGGMIVTNDNELAKQATLLRYHAITRPEEASEHPEYIYDVVDIGNKYDLTQISAAFCLAQLKRLDKALARRREIAAIYDRELASLQHLSIPPRTRESSFFAYIVKIDKNRDGFAKELKERGIQTGLHFIPLHLLSYYKSKYALKVNHFPCALRNYQQVLSLPIHPSLSDEEVLYICEQIKIVDKGRV